MLEFQEGFFEQEVREGFYLDVTMKTLWAAEMELLNTINEVCAKYNLQWYAAYGTLLGAIRHEGYVPWDDDMDIWMMRKDYNKLMEVLPKEMPSYRVRSPLTDEGYDQYHTCVNNGSGISIAKEWLDQNHNCPFTVGLDIFPLDYVPRNKKDREMQNSLFILIGRCAQIAKNVGRGDYEKEDAVMTREDALQQLKDGLQYLKKNYKFTLDKKLLQEEEWDRIAAEIWKWDNYVAMMYDESECDLIAEYLDYARWDYKIFPKEWFKEVYSATFENFMIPIPSGYHELLYTIYGDYWHYIPNAGFHEYPYYARQLRQLREYVKDVESRAERVGIISIDDIEPEEHTEIPEEWKHFVYDDNGARKKIILMAHDISVYLEDTEEKLENLQKTLDYMKEHRDKVVLWWRPHAQMFNLLAQIDQAYADRYASMLEDYKKAAWGICDETDNSEIAAVNCDAYYGELNVAIQQVQNNRKPVMLKDYYGPTDNNKQRERQFMSYVCNNDYVTVNNKQYCASTNYNALICKDTSDGSIEFLDAFPESVREEKNLHMKCVEKAGKICFLPVGSGNAHVYNVSDGKIKSFSFGETGNNSSWNWHKCGEDYYLLPSGVSQGVWKWIPEKEDFEKAEWWKPVMDTGVLIHGSIDDDTFYTLERRSNRLCIANIKEESVKMYDLPHENVVEIVYDGEVFWYQIAKKSKLVQWQLGDKRGKVVELPCVDEYNPDRDIAYYPDMYCVGSGIILFNQVTDKVYWFDKSAESMQCVMEMDWNQKSYTLAERKPSFKQDGDKLVILFTNMDKKLIVDLNSMQIGEEQEEINLSDTLIKYQRNVLLDRNALLYEETSVYDLEMLVDYLS